MYQARQKKLTVAILAHPDSSASVICGMYDLFASAGYEWDMLVHGKAGVRLTDTYIIAQEATDIEVAHGASVKAHKSFSHFQQPDIICIPDLAFSPHAFDPGRYRVAADWVAKCYAQGASVASVCTGTFLLAEAGLPDFTQATTHWGYCDLLRRRYKHLKVHPDRILVETGAGQRIATAGGGLSWQDMMLYLISKYLGEEQAIKLSKINLMNWNDRGQLPYTSLMQSQKTADLIIAKCQEWLGDHYSQDAPVAGMAQVSGLGERTFKRRFAKVTGMTPMDYVHVLRLEEAKQLLERSTMPMEGVAFEVGYEDASFFRRLFKRKVGLTPTEYRRRFGDLRRRLSSPPTLPAG